MATAAEKNGRQEQVIAAIRGRISDGHLMPGQRLPPVRDLADDLGLDKGTVVRAYRRLVTMGIVSLEGGGSRPRPVVHGHVPGAVGSSEVIAIANVTSAEVIDPCRRVAVVTSLMASLHAANLSMTAIPSSWLNPQCRRPAAVIVLEALTPTQVQVVATWQRQGTAVVSGDEVFSPPGADLVLHDHAAGAAALVRVLHDHGRRCLMPMYSGAEIEPPWQVARCHGLEQEAGRLGMRLLDAVRWTARAGAQDRAGFDQETTLMAGLSIAQLAGADRADAALALSDGMVPLLAAVCDRIGRRVHADLAITGYDGYWRNDAYQAFRPQAPLATIDKDNRAIGAEMASRAVARIGGDRRDPVRIVLPPRLILPST